MSPAIVTIFKSNHEVEIREILAPEQELKDGLAEDVESVFHHVDRTRVKFRQFPPPVLRSVGQIQIIHPSPGKRSIDPETAAVDLFPDSYISFYDSRKRVMAVENKPARR